MHCVCCRVTARAEIVLRQRLEQREQRIHELRTSTASAHGKIQVDMLTARSHMAAERTVYVPMSDACLALNDVALEELCFMKAPPDMGGCACRLCRADQ